MPRITFPAFELRQGRNQPSHLNGGLKTLLSSNLGWVMDDLLEDRYASRQAQAVALAPLRAGTQCIYLVTLQTLPVHGISPTRSPIRWES